MAWIKRNLFFVIGGIIALLLLGAAGFYIYTAWDKNAKANGTLVEVVGNLKTLVDQKPSPGNEKVDNIKIAQEQDKEIKKWVASSSAYFEPIPSIPAAGSVSVANFSGALQNTLKQLHNEAEAAGVILPPNYDFSFASEKNKLAFAPGGLEPLAAQLGEVRAICGLLFAARINALDGIQRVRMSDDDMGPGAAQADYLEARPITNELAVITPYIISFRCFTPELSRVVGSFAKAPNTYIVKSINVLPAGAAMGMPGGAGEGMPGMPPMRPMVEGYMPPAQPVPVQSAASKGGSQPVLKEQLLRVTVEVELVKLLPKN